jgi:hypothetical protein
MQLKSPCNAGSVQRWSFMSNQTVGAAGRGFCVATANTNVGQNVQATTPCTSTLTTQRWLYDDQRRLRVLAAPHLCMWAGASPSSGSLLTLNPCGNTTSYQWNATGEDQGQVCGRSAAPCGRVHARGTECTVRLSVPN